MQYEEGTIGRIFVLRLEEGDRLPQSIETFAQEHGVRAAAVFYLGGAADGSKLVVGPEANRGDTIVPIIHKLQGTQEVMGVGTLFPNESGEPILHLHAATGREGKATVGCTRAGVEVWLVGEVIILEIAGSSGERKAIPGSPLELLELGDSK